MKAAIVARSGSHQESWSAAMAEGLARHGVEVLLLRDADQVRAVDFAVCWGWRSARRLRARGLDVLVMERGYLGDRFVWTSLGWNGLNGRARFPDSGGPERLNRLFPEHLAPWREGGTALLLGQVEGDCALEGINVAAWYRDAAAALQAKGWRVAFRQHPVEIERGMRSPYLPGVERRQGGCLSADLTDVGLAVAWNSNGLTDCACLGVPVMACDKGAMAWPVAAHGLDTDPVRPQREAWAEWLAWCQWSEEEMASGEAWEHVGPCR